MGLHESMTELQELSRKMKFYLTIAFGGILLFIPGLFIPSLALLGITASFACMIIGMSKYTKVLKVYKLKYKQIFVEEPLAKNFDNLVYIWDSGFTERKVTDFQLCSMGNRFSSEDYIRAQFENVPFELSDVTVQYHTSGKNSRTVTYFKGRMMFFQLPGKMVKSVWIYSDNFKYRPFTKFFGVTPPKIEMESVNFNKNFDIYSSYEHDAFYLLTPQFMEKLEYLRSKYNSIAIHVTGDYAVIGFNEPLNNAFDAKNPQNELSYPEEMEKIQADINDIKEIIRILRDIQINNNINNVLSTDERFRNNNFSDDPYNVYRIYRRI